MCVYPENRGQKRDVGGLNLPGTVIIIAGSTTLHDFGSIFVLCRYRLGWDLFGHLSATEENIMDYDVLVVGGGPAGCATARDIAAEGFRVLVAEEHSAVGEPLQCSGLISSRALELSQVSNHVVLNELKGALVYAPDNRIFNLVGERIYGLAIDRVAFDQELAVQAREAGAEIRKSSRVIHLTGIPGGIKARIQTKGSVSAEHDVSCRLVIGADGYKSLVASWLGLLYPSQKVSIYAAEVELTSTNEQAVKIFLGQELAPAWFAWVIPAGRKLARVGIGVVRQGGFPACRPGASQLFLQLMKAHPKIFKDLRVLKCTGGVVPIGLMKRSYGNHALLVGDAACHIKPISGGGLYLGLEAARCCAEAAVSSLKARDYSSKFLSNYQRAWKGKVGQEISCGLMHRDVFLKMSDQEIDNMIAFLDTPYWRRIILKYADLDYHSVLAGKLAFAPPWAHRFLLKGLISFVNRCSRVMGKGSRSTLS
jgi:digeranylgeranylglycerophospholipid reductase